MFHSDDHLVLQRQQRTTFVRLKDHCIGSRMSCHSLASPSHRLLTNVARRPATTPFRLSGWTSTKMTRVHHRCGPGWSLWKHHIASLKHFDNRILEPCLAQSPNVKKTNWFANTLTSPAVTFMRGSSIDGKVHKLRRAMCGLQDASAALDCMSGSEARGCTPCIFTHCTTSWHSTTEMTFQF